MDVTTAEQSGSELEVLSEDELKDIVGGDLYDTANGARSFVMGKIGGCQCGVGH